MSCFKVQKAFWVSLQLYKVNTRCIGGLSKKIKNSYFFSPGGDIMLSSLRIGDIIDQSADKCGDTVAIISAFQNITKTYSEFRHEVERLASGLISIGLKKGDRLAICAPNCYEWPLTQYAAAKAGLILVNINPAFQSMELEYCLKKVDCKALVIWDNLLTQNYYKMMCDIIPDLPKSTPGKLQSSKLPNLESVVMISKDNKNGLLNFKDVLNNGNTNSDEMLSEIENSIQFDDPANIQFTSGTTGAPKGAVLTHHNLVNNALIMGQKFGFHIEKPIVCCQLPLFHSFGCVQTSLAPLFYQGTMVFPSPIFHAVSSLTAIQNHKCSVIFGAPTMFVDIIRNYQSEKFNIGSLKRSLVGGSASPSTLIRDMKEVLGIPNVQRGYGTTETSPAVICNRYEEDFENALNGIMQPIEYIEVKIIDSKGNLVPVNTKGELCTRGHNTFIGYWNEEKKTAEVLDKTHWYHTGDIAVMDEDGYVKIVGRIKEMIIRGGENIYPVEVENFLNTHPFILEVHVCGVPDSRLGEEACAWICLKEGKQLSEEEVKEFCKGKISHYKIPRYIIFVTDFPKTASGKVKKFEMTKTSVQKLKL